MATTKRKDIMNDLLYRLSAIRQSQGYATDINCASRHRDTDAEPYTLDDVPAINAKDGKCPVTHQGSQDEHALDVRVDIVTTSQALASDVDAIMADVLACIEANGTWGGHADGTNVEAHGIDLSQGGDTITSGIIDIVVYYTTDVGKA